MRVFKTFLPIVLLMVLFTGLVNAEPSAQLISRDQAISIVKEHYDGKVLKVELKQKPKSSYYRVKLITKEGRVKVLRVDGTSGDLR